ncbi:MAG TPA: CARDB domain-containing protein [Candidatus Paceibacterota bacterium]|nr:CARDB domain-containing protein [Candidatus Paceibacterota bacterium]
MRHSRGLFAILVFVSAACAATIPTVAAAASLPAALDTSGLTQFGSAIIAAATSTPASGGTSWLTQVGSGIVAPACGSSSITSGPTCNNGSPVVSLQWTAAPGSACTTATPVSISMNGTVVATSQHCNGTYTWNGGSSGQSYTYSIFYSYGGYLLTSTTDVISTNSFTMPYCTTCSATNACGQTATGVVVGGICTSNPPSNYVYTNTITPSGHWLGTYDDFRGNYSGQSVYTAESMVCQLAGKPAPLGATEYTDYAPAPDQNTYGYLSGTSDGYGGFTYSCSPTYISCTPVCDSYSGSCTTCPPLQGQSCVLSYYAESRHNGGGSAYGGSTNYGGWGNFVAGQGWDTTSQNTGIQWVACGTPTPLSPPPVPANFGQTCTATNACGQSNTGTIECDGVTCSATAPPDSRCTLPGLYAGPTTVTPTPVVATVNETLSAPVYNVGTATAYNFDNLFQIAQHSGVGGATTTVALLDGGTVASLAVNANTTISATYQFPSAGTYEVRACANHNTSWQLSVNETNTGDDCGPWLYLTVANPPPTVTLSADSYTIDQGQSATITWTSSNTTSCTGSGFSTGGATSGSVTVTPAVTTPYGITCTGPGGSSPSPSITITVIPPGATITASPARVHTGSQSTISWSSQAVKSCKVSGPGVSSAALSGSQTVAINSQSVYTISCQTFEGTMISQKTTVNTVPTFQEF